MSLLNRLLENIGSVVLGKPEVIKLAVVALLAEGHVLIEDVPGVGKTLLARALAASIDCSFRRIQFTPDLLPSDILGSSVYNAAIGRVRLQAGPDLRQRDPGRRDQPDHPPDPERLARSDERRPGLGRGQDVPARPAVHRAGDPEPLRVRGDLRPAREPARPVHDPAPDGLSAPLRGAQGPREPPRRRAGRDAPAGAHGRTTSCSSSARSGRSGSTTRSPTTCSTSSTRPAKARTCTSASAPRGALTLYRAAQSLALVSGRDYVVPDDVKTLAVPVLAHRVVGKSFLQAGEFGAAEAIIRDLVDRLRVPS